MSDLERSELLEILQKAAEEAKTMSADEAMQKLVDDGFYTAEGELTARYGGKGKR